MQRTFKYTSTAHKSAIHALRRNPEQTTASSSASSYCQWWCTSRDLRPIARSTLINLLGITNLLCLSPNKLLMPIYLINQIASPPLTGNNTKCCTHMISPSNQLSSPMDSSLSHSQPQQVTTRLLCCSSNSVGYISRLLWTQIIQYRLCNCLYTSSSSQSLHLTTACCTWMFHAQTWRYCCQRSCRACQEAAIHNFASLLALFLRFLTCLSRFRRLQLRKSALFLFLS